MRQYGEVPPWVGAGPAPAVISATGLGTGGGASVSTADGSGFGEVLIMTGSNPSANGNVHLAFGTVPPSLFLSGDEAFGTLASANNPSSDITFSWSGGTLKPNKRYRMHYEWAASF